jgi:hypothetical protein
MRKEDVMTGRRRIFYLKALIAVCLLKEGLKYFSQGNTASAYRRQEYRYSPIVSGRDFLVPRVIPGVNRGGT